MTSCFQWFESYLAHAAVVLWTSSRLFLLAEGLVRLSGPFCNVNAQSSTKERKELREIHTYFIADISGHANSLFDGIWKFKLYPFTFSFDVGH